MGGFLWRAWFFMGLGGTVAVVIISAMIGHVPTLIRYYMIVCGIGLIAGTVRVILFRENPFRFFQ